MNDFSKRVFLPELMDDDACDGTLLIRTVRQFRTINRLFSNTRSILKRFVLCDATQSFSIVDVGAGGGDIMRWLVDQCRKKRIDVQATCLDSDPRIAAFAEEACRDYPEITVRLGRLEEIPGAGQFDYVFANHLLHHFPTPTLPSVLATLYSATGHRLIVSDLRRSKTAHAAFGLYAALFCPRSFARTDGMLSIRKGFTRKELEGVAFDAGIGTMSKILKHPPARLVLIADAPGREE